jgi:predicted enzyme related to lactoylglutathione lyase
MIVGMHALMYSADAAADRAFLRDVLGFKFVDDGDGWLIFQLPPSEVGVHPADGGTPHHELFLMVDDIAATLDEWRAKGVEVSHEPADRGFGVLAMIRLPSGADLGVYEPRHATAYDL